MFPRSVHHKKCLSSAFYDDTSWYAALENYHIFFHIMFKIENVLNRFFAVTLSIWFWNIIFFYMDQTWSYQFLL